MRSIPTIPTGRTNEPRIHSHRTARVPGRLEAAVRRPGRDGRADRHRDRVLRDLRDRLPLLCRQESRRPDAGTGPRPADPGVDPAALEQRHHRARRPGAARGPRRALPAVAFGRFGTWWLVTFLLGLGFLVLTAREWIRLIGRDHLTIATNLFGTTFYTLVGLHATHVTVGLTIIGLVMVLAWRGHLSPRHAERTELFSWYWHFVDAVWVVVFLTVYVIGR